MSNDLWNTIGIFASLLGLVFGVAFGLYQWRRTISIERRRREQLWASLDRSRYVILDHVEIERYAKQFNDSNLSQCLWLNHQAASDLYISLVEQYLAQEKKFTYKDLERLCKNGFIHLKWQEKQWRYLICRRPENMDAEPPEYFITEDKRSHRLLKGSETGK